MIHIVWLVCVLVCLYLVHVSKCMYELDFGSLMFRLFFFFFFFQAEDGIRYLTVTGVQTCALPICPTPSSVLTICPRTPATIDAMAMTVAIPMTTPRMVSPERSLLARSWSTAISQPSRMEWRVMLFRAQRVDRIEACRPVRGVDEIGRASCRGRVEIS